MTLSRISPTDLFGPDQRSTHVAFDGFAIVRQYLSDLSVLSASLDQQSLGHIVSTIAAALIDRRTVFLAGNGGSATTAAHMVVDWTTASTLGGWKSSVVNLAESAARLTAIGNDVDFSEIFSRQIRAQAEVGDLLVLLSVSGSSPNLVNAARAATELGVPVIGLLGFAGQLTRYCDQSVLFGQGDYGLTEDLHLSVNHMVARALRGGKAHIYRPSSTGDD